MLRDAFFFLAGVGIGLASVAIYLANELGRDIDEALKGWTFGDQ